MLEKNQLIWINRDINRTERNHMDNFFDSIKAILYERVNNPIVSGFATSWAIVNYKFFLIIFFGDSLSHRINEINILFSNESNFLGIENFLFNGLIVPITITIFYIYILPAISSHAISYYYKSITNLKNKKLENEGHELLSVEKSRALRIKIKELEARNRVAAEEAASDIEAHMLRIKELEEKIASQEKTLLQIREVNAVPKDKNAKKVKLASLDKMDLDDELALDDEIDLKPTERTKPKIVTRSKSPATIKPKTFAGRAFPIIGTSTGRYTFNRQQKSIEKSTKQLNNSRLSRILPESKDVQALREILLALYKSKLTSMSILDISNNMKRPTVEVDFYINVLEKNNLVSSSIAARGGIPARMIKITEEGTKLIVDIIGEKT